MSTNEIHCQTCDYYFSGTTTFHIHLKSCENSINTDPKNKYSCPVCNKQFRVLNNLERHEETSKHKKLIEWHKQRDDTLNNNFESESLALAHARTLFFSYGSPLVRLK
jgi:hypothetical protein